MSESTVVMIPEPMPPFGEVHLAAAGFLSRYPGKTRTAYALDLKTYFMWCSARGAEVFAMTRPHLELYVRWMEEDRGYAPATTPRRLSTVVGFYRFAVIDGTYNVVASKSPRMEVFGLEGTLLVNRDDVAAPPVEVYRLDAAPGLAGWIRPQTYEIFPVGTDRFAELQRGALIGVEAFIEHRALMPAVMAGSCRRAACWPAPSARWNPGWTGFQPRRRKSGRW